MISKAQAMAATHGTIFCATNAYNADRTPLRARVNGKCQTWITRPNEFRLPMKYGLKHCFYITHENAEEWAINATAAIVEGP